MVGLFLLTKPVFAQTQDDPWHYTILNGLPSSTIYEILRDSKNQLWFGTENGVVCFNGQDFLTYTTNEGLNDNVVIRVLEDSYGRIWFHHQGKLPTYWKDGAIYSIETDDKKFIVDAASNFIENERGEVIIIGKEGVLTVDSKGKTKAVVNDNPLSKFLCFYKNSKNRIICASNYSFEQPVLDAYGKNYTNIARQIAYLIENDVFNLETQRIVPYLEGIIDIEKPGPKDLELCCILRLKEALSVRKIRDKIFVCRENGLSVFSQVNGNWEEKTYLEGIIVSNVQSDISGGIWVGTITHGLYNFTNLFLNLETIFDKAPVSFLGKIKGEVWIGTSTGEVYKLINDQPVFVCRSISHNNAQPRVNEIKAFKDMYLISTGSTLLAVRPDGRVEQIGPLNYYRNVFVQNNKIIAHSAAGIHYIEQKGDGTFVLRDFDRSIGRVHGTAVDGDTLLFGTQNGLIAYLHGKEVSWRNNLLKKESVNFIQKQENGSFLIGSGNNGFYVVGRRIHKQFTRKNGLISNDIRSLTDGKNGRFLLIQEGGVQEMSIYMDSIITHGNFDLRTHFKGLDIDQVIRVGDFLYIDQLEQLVRVPYSVIQPVKQLDLAINSIRIGQKIVELKDKYQVKHYEDRIEIRLSVNNFSTNKTTYLYRLNGGPWVENTTGIIELQSLKEGDYLVEMMAQSRMRKSSEIRKMYLTIIPPWYRSTWIITLAVALIVALIALGLRFRYRRIESRKRELMMMELGALQAQMNPHFTFNTLNSIQNYILKNDTRSSIKYLSEFSMLMRKILDYAQIQLISIEEEMSFLKSYISLEKQRLKDGFQEELEIDSSLPANVGIPSMLLQPFVENAIWHGLAHMREGGVLGVHFERIENRLIVTISDNGKGRKHAAKRMGKESKHQSKGMSITQNRIRIIERLYKAKIEFSIFDLDESEETGTIVRIDLPILYTNQ